MKSKELRAKRAKLIEDARALISGATPSAEDTAKFDAMMAEADTLKGQIDRLERADELHAQTLEQLHADAAARGVSPDEEKARREVEAGTFRAYIRGGMASLTPEQRQIAEPRFQAAQGEGSNTSGGYTVPQGFYGQLMDAELAYGGMIDVSFIVDTGTGNQLPIPTDNDTSNKGAILGENPTSQPTQDIVFGSVTLNAYTYTSKLVLVSNQLLQDSFFNLDAFLSMKLGTRLARITNQHFTTGTGANQPSGIVTDATAGPTAAAATVIGSDDLIELEHAVDPAYRKGARFMMADGTLKKIKQLKDGQGRPLWLPGLAVKEPDTINGYPYSINQDMTAVATGVKSMLFGDFSKYFIRRVAGVQVLRLTERYAELNQTGFLAFQRWDGRLVDAGTHPVKYLLQP